ncbi:OmpA family protein [Neolewinella aurantiaca]|nr:OmpA family protein [Neolewinella aurantiaca]
MRYLYTLCLLTLLCTCASAQGENLRLTESVYFSSAAHEPNAEQTEKLVAFANTLSSYADYSLKIEAFTDEKGTEAFNKALAERRANAIAEALASRNVVSSAVEVLSYGEQRARQNTTDDTERSNDRRVDLVATVTRWESADAAIKTARAEQLQTITIANPTVRQAISGNKGGAFLIEANSLIYPDGTPATGPVSVELIEAYDLSDMLIAGLTTTAAGKRLVTGGMISLTAKDAEGTPLSLRTGASITAATPTDDFNEQMRIFSGANHDENGTPTDWAITTGGVANSAEALFRSLPPLPELITYRLVAEENIGSRMYAWRQANPEPQKPTLGKVDHNFLSRKPVPPVLEEIVYEPKGLGGVFESKAKRDEKTAELRRKATAAYERHQERYDRAVAYHEGLPARNEALKAEYAAAAKDWQDRFDAKKESLMSVEMRRLRAEEAARREKYMAARAARTAALGEQLAGLNDLTGQQSNISRYFFSVNQLGWTNVDIYPNEQGNIQLFARVENSTRDATVVLIPTDRRSVIAYQPGLEEGVWQRRGIPAGVGYHVIAYQVMEGKLVMAHRFVDKATNVPAQLSYEPVAITDLKDRIAGILGS